MSKNNNQRKEEYTDSGSDRNIYSEGDNDYFSISSNNKTSKNVDTEPLDNKRFIEEISKVIPKHRQEKEILMESYYLQNKAKVTNFTFNKMYNDLKLNYNLLISGVGSKIELVESFVNELCNDGPSITFKGYLPNLSVKDLLFRITFSLFGIDKKFSTPIVHCNFIKSIFESKDTDRLKSLFGGTFTRGVPNHLYILIHNIDGYSLRNDTSQTTLALLATIPQVHIIATIDAIGAQLLWDSRMLENFSWTTYSLPTYKSYDIELSYDSLVSSRGGGSGGRIISSGGTSTSNRLQPTTILTVLKSLTDISTEIFKELLICLIGKKKKKIEFKTFFDICSDCFLVSSEQALKSQLREFIDHKIIFQKDIGDTSFLFLPIETSTMEIVLSQLEASAQE